jgi:hypothetical protein
VPFTVSVKADVPAIVDVAEREVMVGAGGAFTVIALLKADVTLAEVAQILMLCAVEYCIEAYVMTPAVTAAPLAGVDVSVPLPAVPPQTCVESTTAKLTVDALSELSVFPYWSSRAMTGFVVKFTLVVAVVGGCVV